MSIYPDHVRRGPEGWRLVGRVRADNGYGEPDWRYTLISVHGTRGEATVALRKGREEG